MAAARAIASLIREEELRRDYVIVSPFDPRVVSAVAKAVGDMAREEGYIRP
jgi:malate dehydrogenase (oxaloacetate-decarboxylating)